MDDDDIPDISEATIGEGCTVALIIIAMVAAMNSWGLSVLDPSSGFGTFAIAAGLASIAVAILSVGRKMNREGQ